MSRSPQSLVALSVTVLLGLILSSNVLAHHPMGGEAPQTYLQGLLSGLGHPVIELDHLAFIAGVGVVLGLGLTRRLVAPLAIAAGAVAGTVLQWSGITVPLFEVIVALSLLGAGAAILFEPQRKNLLTAALSAAALCHGQAYGEAVLGAEPTPVLAYLIGFTIIQAVIAAAFCWATTGLSALGSKQVRLWRVASGMALGGTGSALLTIAMLT
ncbi:MAG: hypothetical protein FKY71_11455 [Spiribacter salinus]|uniref:HupE/UreJ family protein n=1 Tax=Spiribacter salinus TaxID=1335746 RepID=A0A540VQE9_9GAMM|nr:MAG: hypothetical protein FKY71_11455 [Spiribacter salinus]